MSIFDVLNLFGGLALFLFGMSVMGNALERRAGSGLRSILEKLTDSKLTGLLTGLGVTAIIQSSSATTVMVVGFVNSGLIFLVFATLMFGMEMMSTSVAGLKEVPTFSQLFLLFSNPVLGVLAGAVLTAIIQSGSASVGILHALASTGQVTYGATIPIIMGQNIGTCVTALLSSVGTTKNAKRAAFIHLSFNIIGTGAFLILFCIVKYIFMPMFLTTSVSMTSIAVIHSIFTVGCTVLLFPFTNILEKVAIKLIPDKEDEEFTADLDTHLFSVPALALGQARKVMLEMVECSQKSIVNSLSIMMM